MSAKAKAQDFILHVLERGPLSPAQIKAEAGDFSPATMERALSGLVQIGKVHKVQRGLYALTEALKETSITSPIGYDVIDGNKEWVTERI